jgi:hypothetical protein
MRLIGIAMIAQLPASCAAAEAEILAPGQISSQSSYAPAPGNVAEPYQDAPVADRLQKGPPGLVSEVHFVNDRFDAVFMRTKLLNGVVQNLRITRGQMYSAPTQGEPAICMCWDYHKPVYQCLSPDPVAVPTSTTFHFGQGGTFQKCRASF